MIDEGKVVIFVTSGPETPQRCATPFYMASVEAALDHEAELIFQIDGVVGAAYMTEKGLEADMVLCY